MRSDTITMEQEIRDLEAELAAVCAERDAAQEAAALWSGLVAIIESTERPWEKRTPLMIQAASGRYIVDRDVLAEVVRAAQAGGPQ